MTPSTKYSLPSAKNPIDRVAAVSPKSKRQVGWGTWLIASGFAGLTVWLLSQSTLIAMLSLAVVAAGLLGIFVGWRVAALSVAMCAISPSVLAETWGWLALAAFIMICGLLAFSPVETQVRPRGAWIPPILLALEGIAFGLTGGLGTPGIKNSLGHLAFYWPAALAIYLAFARPRYVAKALRGLTWIVTLAVFSYVVSWMLGFVDPLPFVTTERSLVIFAPASLTTGYIGGGFWAGFSPHIPRLTVLAGEPGLSVVFIIIAIWFAISFSRGMTRTLMLVLLGLGALATGSTAMVFAVIAMGLGAALGLARRFNLAVAVVLALGVIPALGSILHVVLLEKAKVATTGSLVYRGLVISQSEVRIAPSYIATNLISTLYQKPALAIPLLLLIVYLVVATIRRPWSLGLVLAFSIVALFAQPMQNQPGAWFLLVLCVLIADPLLLRASERTSASPGPP